MLVAADYKTMFARDGYVLVEDLFTRECQASVGNGVSGSAN